MAKRLRTQRRGAGGNGYRSPSHRHVNDVRLPVFDEKDGVVKDLIHAPGRTSPLAIIDYDGTSTYQIAAEGVSVGQRIAIGGTKIIPGNITKLTSIPEGTAIHNIEGSPGDGGKYAKVAGVSAVIVSRGSTVIVQMPSGTLKEFNPNCRAAIGAVAGNGKMDKPLVKAGKNYHALHTRSKANFHVSGVAMNAVDHPHGGGSHPHIGGPSTKSRNAWPGQKVGRLSPEKKERR
ncbi:MAG: 50S ribosomal protein L2 [archaeon]|nr:50S ribosomal protein L2 [archaeon]